MTSLNEHAIIRVVLVASNAVATIDARVLVHGSATCRYFQTCVSEILRPSTRSLSSALEEGTT
jgi:hypothetical protein